MTAAPVHGSSRRSIVWLVAAVVAAAGVLGGCRVDATVSVAVGADGSGSITLTLVADADLVARAPGLAADLRFADAVAAGWVVTGPAATSDGGLRVDLVHPFADVAQATALLANINGAGGPLHDVSLTRTADGATTDVRGVLRVDGGLDAFSDPDLLAALGAGPYANAIAASGSSPDDVAAVTLRLSLPGSVSDFSGTRRGDAVVWTAPLDGSTVAVTASSRLGGSSGLWSVIAGVAVVLLVVWLLVGAALAVLVVRARRRRAARRPG